MRSFLLQSDDHKSFLASRPMWIRTVFCVTVLLAHPVSCSAEGSSGLLWEARAGELTKLEYGPVSLLADGKYGAPGLFRAPVFKSGSSSPAVETPTTEKQDDALVQRFSWGSITLAPVAVKGIESLGP